MIPASAVAIATAAGAAAVTAADAATETVAMEWRARRCLVEGMGVRSQSDIDN